ncbi:unnamed protein product [Mycena citricolor]|uniref:Uncharacterized protein n=1 Tax=Mycena citricolor TaxID=2018698 RepID=A0AAD2JYG6_9AGAR|nr:unnamed protein product [Mycena citricolor]
MATVCVYTAPPTPTTQRKRTTSFSSPPRKRLHRTESSLDLSLYAAGSSSSASPSTTTTMLTAVPHRSLRYHKEQKDGRRRPAHPSCATSSSAPSFPSLSFQTTAAVVPPSPLSLSTPSPSKLKATVSFYVQPPAPTRSQPPADPPGLASHPCSSPLSTSASKRAYTPPSPPRAPFPPSKSKSKSKSLSQAKSRTLVLPPTSIAPALSKVPKPSHSACSDLHRRALTACMRTTPSGSKILHMGARLAVGIMSATEELERICTMDVEDAGLAGDDLDLDLDLDLDAEIGDIPDEDVDELLNAASELLGDSDPDVAMADVECAPMSTSWIVVAETPCAAAAVAKAEDWEMIVA